MTTAEATVTDQAELELPGDLAAIAKQADAQLAGEPAPGAPGQAEAEQVASEREQLLGMLCLGISVAGHALPSIAKAYNPQACDAIVGEYLRCADHYGWTFHKNAASAPIVGLAAAIAVPGLMNAKAIAADIRSLRGDDKQPSSSSAAPMPLPPMGGEGNPHAGIRL